MAQISLARQYRPQRFEDVCGQDHVTRTLQNAIQMDRTAQAYLFCGPRGVGKTTVARILAKALNCEQGPTAEPCGTCESCRRITNGSSMSVIEIDAASNRKIEDIRSLREDVQFTPTDARLKVYILDEAHQITREGFEAFLKTLEEPPPHVVFVLATTDPQKMPPTILSRCQRFDFRRVAVDDIVARLARVSQDEQLTVEPAAFYAVARAADGGLRDALSLLDQLIAYSGTSITNADVEAVLGTLAVETRFALGDVLAERDVPAALSWLSALIDAGRDARLIVGEALNHSRLLLLARIGCGEVELRTLPADIQQRLRDQAARFDPPRLMAIMEGWAAADKALRWHPQPRILLETALIDLLLASDAPGVAPVVAPAPPRADDEPPRYAPEPVEAAPVRRPAPPAPPPPRPVTPVARVPLPPAGGAAEDHALSPDEPLTLEAVRSRQSLFLARMREGWMPLTAHLVHGEVVGVEQNTIVYGFHGWEASLNLCLMPERKRIIEAVWQRLLGRPVAFRGELVNERAGDEPADAVDDLDQAVVLAKSTFPESREIDS